MGSIVKGIDDDPPSYYFCSMPACDSVRIENKQFFPLHPLEPAGGPDTSSLWVSIKDGETAIKLRLKVGPKFASFVEFKANKEIGRVLAILKKETKNYVFESIEKRKFQWLCDLDPLHAQRLAAANLEKWTRVGVDEFEWLRRGL